MVGLPWAGVVPTVPVRVRRRLMGSLVDELQRREAAARAEAEELRGQIAQLTGRLAGVEDRLSRLVITRETVDEVLSEAGPEASPAVMADGTVPSRSGHLLAAGVLAVPPWRAGVEASVLPQAYRDLLEVAEDACRPLRAEQKRLVERGWLAEEAGPGLFGLPACNGSAGAGEAANLG